jgi:hypothetical protein
VSSEDIDSRCGADTKELSVLWCWEHLGCFAHAVVHATEVTKVTASVASDASSVALNWVHRLEVGGEGRHSADKNTSGEDTEGSHVSSDGGLLVNASKVNCGVGQGRGREGSKGKVTDFGVEVASNEWNSAKFASEVNFVSSHQSDRWQSETSKDNTQSGHVHVLLHEGREAAEAGHLHSAGASASGSSASSGSASGSSSAARGSSAASRASALGRLSAARGLSASCRRLSASGRGLSASGRLSASCRRLPSASRGLASGRSSALGRRLASAGRGLASGRLSALGRRLPATGRRLATGRLSSSSGCSAASRRFTSCRLSSSGGSFSSSHSFTSLAGTSTSFALS